MGHITIDRVGTGGQGAAIAPDWAALTAYTFPDANTDNWVPPPTTDGWAITMVSDRDLTGLVPPLGTAVQQNYWFTNVGADKHVKLKHEDTNSLAANRFLLPEHSDIDLKRGETLILSYDPAVSRWRVLRFDKT